MLSKKLILAFCLTIALFLIGMAFALVPAYSAGKVINPPPAGSKTTVITHYEFGSMEVDGQLYKMSYLRIFPDGTVSPWPVVSHYIELTDIEKQIDENTRVLIIGMGDSGAVIVPKETRERIRARGIELHCLKTATAAELFNKLPKENLVALFHLTC